MAVSGRVAACIVFLFALSACGARNIGAFVPSNAPAAGRHRVAGVIRPVDMGRIAPVQRVSAVVVLRYNHQRELDALVNRMAREPHPHYLAPQEFRARFAPTPQQQQRVIQELRAAGFTIDRTYENRTTIDASAPARNVERFFSTQLHRYNQGRHGMRVANVKPVRIPHRLQALVAAVDVNNLVLLHPSLEVQGDDAQDATPNLSPDVKNAVRNPGFESGKLKPWTACGTTKTTAAAITKVHPHAGKFDGYAGTFQNQQEPNGIAALCQKVAIPRGATLTFYSYGISNDRNKKVIQFAALYTTGGKLLKVLSKGHRNDKNWREHSYDLSAFGGQSDLLVFGVVGNSKDKNKVIGQFVDDVSVAGASATPTPAPTPPPCKPSSVPSSTPTPNSGPDSGWGPAAVAAGFDLPSGYGYGGACETAAIVIDATVNPTDLSTYLSHFGIRHTGTVTNVAVNGGASQDTEGEATLDLETVAGLAPNANVIMYVIPNLSFTDVEDAYNRALSDAKAKVINSSFGGCEASDTSYDAATNALAQQGAATGVTFAASSGDQGSYCYVSSGNYNFGADSPASDPYFVGVGGSQSTSPAGPSQCGDSSASIANPVVWSDCVGAGGGGLSGYWTPPPYQNGISGASTAHRNVPDIAMPAAYDDFYFTGNSPHGWGLIWGTSWASPIYTAMQTELDEACGNAWGINTIYGTFDKVGYADFIDVTSGSNYWLSYYYTPDSYNAATGFDNVSGIGMPLGMAIAVDDCAVPALRHRR